MRFLETRVGNDASKSEWEDVSIRIGGRDPYLSPLAWQYFADSRFNAPCVILAFSFVFFLKKVLFHIVLFIFIVYMGLKILPVTIPVSTPQVNRYTQNKKQLLRKHKSISKDQL